MSAGGEPMKIAELERVPGVHRSTIHHYLNVGLLPRPSVHGPKLHLFDASHVARLAEIQNLKKRGWPLPKIRDHLNRAPSRRRAAPPAATDAEGGLRGSILSEATRLFAERGYHGVRLVDVARALGIGKATIYRHFSSKQALFVDCVEQVRFTLVSKHVRASAESQTALGQQGRGRALAVLHNFGAYRMLNQLLGSLAHGTDLELAGRARTELHAMVTNAEPFLRELMARKLMAQADPELLAYMLWGALMGAGERLTLDDKYAFDDVLDAYLAFTTYGTRGKR